jgi:hypothetical protein
MAKAPPPAKRRCKGRQGGGGQRHTGGARTEATASEIGSESTDDYVVEAIVARRGVGSSLCYLVRWRGYENSTWEPVANCAGCGALIANFEEHAGRAEQVRFRW